MQSTIRPTMTAPASLAASPAPTFCKRTEISTHSIPKLLDICLPTTQLSRKLKISLLLGARLARRVPRAHVLRTKRMNQTDMYEDSVQLSLVVCSNSQCVLICEGMNTITTQIVLASTSQLVTPILPSIRLARRVPRADVLRTTRILLHDCSNLENAAQLGHTSSGEEDVWSFSSPEKSRQ